MIKNKTMKTKLKDLILYSFAGIGICAILMATTNTPQQTTSTVPESHVWEMSTVENDYSALFLYNKVTGEVRKYSSSSTRYSVVTEYDK